jgi:alpha-beta hydrolase superfamily lysophospholipase
MTGYLGKSTLAGHGWSAPSPMSDRFLLLHGALSAADHVAPLSDVLSESAAVHVLEWPGHGTTPLGDAAFSVDGFVQVL